MGAKESTPPEITPRRSFQAKLNRCRSSVLARFNAIFASSSRVRFFGVTRISFDLCCMFCDECTPTTLVSIAPHTHIKSCFADVRFNGHNIILRGYISHIIYFHVLMREGDIWNILIHILFVIICPIYKTIIVYSYIYEFNNAEKMIKYQY